MSQKPGRLEKDLQKLSLDFRRRAGKKQFESKQAERYADTLAEALDAIRELNAENAALRKTVEDLQKQLQPKPGNDPQP